MLCHHRSIGWGKVCSNQFFDCIKAMGYVSLRSIALDEELPKWIEKRSKQEDLLVETTQLNMP
jgi:hypothetical protein